MADATIGGLLTADATRAKVPATDWREAVRAVGDLLVGTGACEPRYVSAMHDAVTEFGPYIVIAPGIAMPHARPESGVKHPGVALVTLATSVAFGHEANDPVDLVLAFAAVDKQAHITTLQQISAFLTDAEMLAAVRGAATDAELHDVLNRTTNQELDR